ncbi:hypothetical protein TNCV_746461 [Trichonephila clavipes]|nr:hypothetical protein TNCV_746461 [Trichonephila clavipes]
MSRVLILARFAWQLLPTTNHETQKDREGLNISLLTMIVWVGCYSSHCICKDRNGIEILALEETKLSEHTNIKLKKISIYRKDRPYGSGGGLAFLVRDVNCKKITLPSREFDLEMQGISITWKRRVISILIFIIPLTKGKLYFDCSDQNTIFLDDLNAKHQSWGCSTNNDRGNDLLNAADDRALIFLNSGLPTHTYFSYGTSEALTSELLALNSIHIVIGTYLAALAVTTFLSSLMLRLIEKL